MKIWPARSMNCIRRKWGNLNRDASGCRRWSDFDTAAFVSFMEDPMYPQRLRQNLLARIQIERPDLFEQLRRQEERFLKKCARMQQEQQN